MCWRFPGQGWMVWMMEALRGGPGMVLAAGGTRGRRGKNKKSEKTEGKNFPDGKNRLQVGSD